MPLGSIQKFLQQEVRAPRLPDVTRAYDWYFEGLRLMLPTQIALRRWQPLSKIICIGASGEAITQIVERSWLGARRLGSADHLDDTLPIVVSLPPEKIFKTNISLPRTAAGSLASAVKLRLQDISPIPPEDAVFAVGKDTSVEKDRICASIAIARKSALKEAQNSFGPQVRALGAEPDSGGEFKYVFKTLEQNVSIDMRLARDWFLLAAGGLLLFSAIQFHLDQQLANLNNYQQELLAELQTTREVMTLFRDDKPDELRHQRGLALRAAIDGLNSTLLQLPEGAVVKSIVIESGNITASGVMPMEASRDAGDWMEILGPSPHPEFDEFRMQVSINPL